MIPLPTNFKRLIILVSVLTSLSVTLAFNLLAYGLPSSASGLPLPPPGAIVPDSNLTAPPPPTYSGTLSDMTQPPVITSVTPLPTYDANYPDPNDDYYTVSGSGFEWGYNAFVNASTGSSTILGTYIISSTQLVVAVPTSVTRPQNGLPMNAFLGINTNTGIFSNMLALAQPAPKMAPPKPVKPTLTAISPNSVDAGGTFSMDLLGDDFQGTAQVWVEKVGRANSWLQVATTVVELPTKLKADFQVNPAGWPGKYRVSVCNAKGFCSAKLDLEIKEVTPSISDVTFKRQMNQLFSEITITGTKFLPQSVVNWGGTNLMRGNGFGQYQYVSDTEIVVPNGATGTKGSKVNVKIINPTNKDSTVFEFIWNY